MAKIIMAHCPEQALTLGDFFATLSAPHVEGYLKTDDEDSLVQLARTVPQGMLAMVLHRSTCRLGMPQGKLLKSPGV